MWILSGNVNFVKNSINGLISSNACHICNSQGGLTATIKLHFYNITMKWITYYWKFGSIPKRLVKVSSKLNGYLFAFRDDIKSCKKMSILKSLKIALVIHYHITVTTL